MIPDDGSWRHYQNRIFAAFSGLVRAHSIGAALGAEESLVVDVEQGVDVPLHPQQHITAAAAIATVRSAPRNEFLAPEGNTAPASVTRLNRDSNLVNKHSQNSRARRSDRAAAP